MLVGESAIICPNCGTNVPLTEALTSQIEKSLRVQYEQRARQQEKLLADKAAQLQSEKDKLEARQKHVDQEVQTRLKIAEAQLTETLSQKLAEEQAQKTAMLQQQLDQEKQRVKAAQAKELDLLKKQQTLEERSEALELEVQRQMAEERKKILEQAAKKAAEEQLLKMREKEDLIRSLESKIGDLQRKIEVGSQERQGEALEEELQEQLERMFPVDQFEEVKKGARGADVLQRVRNSSGKICGTILWESKNTKDFQRPWIEKLKKDQQAATADVAVIMTVALPKEIEQFGLLEDVWVTDYRSCVGLATALRVGLINAQRQKMITAGQDSLKDVVYQYVTGREFAMHIKAMVDAFSRMQEQLDKEKRAMQRIWKDREKQIEIVLDNVIGMRGSIEGLVGTHKVLPEIDTLSLEGVVESDTLKDEG